MRRCLVYISLPCGLALISMPLYAQGLFPGVEVGSLKTWLITFGIGAMFTILWYMIRRWINLVDDLGKSLAGLTLEMKMHRSEANQYGTDINILKRRVNRINDWCNKHNIIHAKCPSCPEYANEIKLDSHD